MAAQPQQELLVCFGFSTFELRADEEVIDVAAGMHAVRVWILGPRGTYSLGESDIYRAPEFEEGRLHTRNGTFVRRMRHEQPGDSVAYGIFGPMEFYEGEDRLVVILSGEAMDDGDRDRDIYRRIEVRDPTGLRCDRKYGYGFPFGE